MSEAVNSPGMSPSRLPPYSLAAPVDYLARPRATVGVDLGLLGGIAVRRDRAITAAERMPTCDDGIDPLAIRDILQREICRSVLWQHQDPVVVVEMPRPLNIPGRPVDRGYSSLMEQLGILRGLCAALGLTLRTVEIGDWQAILKNCGDGDTKARSIWRVERFHPAVELVPKPCRKKQDGIADAVNIADYGAQEVCCG